MVDSSKKPRIIIKPMIRGFFVYSQTLIWEPFLYPNVWIEFKVFIAIGYDKIIILRLCSSRREERRKTIVAPGRKATVSEAPKSKIAEAGEIPSRWNSVGKRVPRSLCLRKECGFESRQRLCITFPMVHLGTLFCIDLNIM